MTTMSDLSVDLQSEIVCRVPLQSMKKVRLTCKVWDTLSKTGIFRKTHMRNDAAREAGECRIVAIMDSSLSLVSVVVNDVNHPLLEIKGKLTCLDKQVKVFEVFYCDGILLCVLKDTSELVVWNPYLGQTRWIEPPSCSHHCGYGYHSHIHALGYDHKKKCHKILRFIDGLSHERVCYEIYDFDSNLWRTIDMDPWSAWFMHIYNTGVPLNGNTYWVASRYLYDHDHLICFDFTSETFGPLLPLPFNSNENSAVSWSLSSFKGDKLSLLLQFIQPSEFEIWVTTMIDPNDVSWSMFFKVHTGPAAEIPFSISGFFLDEEKKVAIVFDRFWASRHTLNIIGEAGFLTEVDVDPTIERVPSSNAHVSFFVPSLVQLQIKNRVEKRITKQASNASMSTEQVDS